MRNIVVRKREKIPVTEMRERMEEATRERARHYAALPEHLRVTPYWPDDESALFWEEYQAIMGGFA
jgi:hypothetical protein